jgi:hypothetical protein
VFDVLSTEQVDQISAIGAALLTRLDPGHQIPQTC